VLLIPFSDHSIGEPRRMEPFGLSETSRNSEATGWTTVVQKDRIGATPCLTEPLQINFRVHL
jgi:hypothetical protein